MRHALYAFVAFALCASTADAARDTPMSRAETEVLVKKDLAERLKVPADQLKVLSASDQTWPDASLGCVARKGVVEPSPVPGFAFTIAHAGKHYVYHSDRRGKFRRCDPDKRLDVISR